jgi:hypothetical protein
MKSYPLRSVVDRRENVFWQECRSMVDEICEFKNLTAEEAWTHYYDLIGLRVRSAKTMSESQLSDLHKRLSDEIWLKVVSPSAGIGVSNKSRVSDVPLCDKWEDLQRRANEINPVLWEVLWERHCSLKSLGRMSRRSVGSVFEAIDLDLVHEASEKFAREQRIVRAKG